MEENILFQSLAFLGLPFTLGKCSRRHTIEKKRVQKKFNIQPFYLFRDRYTGITNNELQPWVTSLDHVFEQEIKKQRKNT